MVISGRWYSRPFTVSIKRDCLTVSLDEPSRARVFTYDRSGRLWSAYAGGVLYRRGLNGRVLAKSRQPGVGRQRRWLAAEDAIALEHDAWLSVIDLFDSLIAGHAVSTVALPNEAQTICDRIRAFDGERSRRDVENFQSIYTPVGILPPDQYLAVVLQATEGCSFNTCTFCAFYRTSRFRIKPVDEFRQHADDVRRFLGDGLSLRRTIFLADANALVIPTPRLELMLDVASEIFDTQGARGIFAFLDAFSGDKKSVKEYKTLARSGLHRVYIGLESGNAELLAFLRKPGKPGDARSAVYAMKEAGLSVGVIVLLGAGGHPYAEAHVRDTVAAINSMPLDGKDIIYFSELIAGPDVPYAKDAAQAGLRPLSQSEQLAQEELMRRGFEFSNRRDTPRVSRYDIREFIY